MRGQQRQSPGTGRGSPVPLETLGPAGPEPTTFPFPKINLLSLLFPPPLSPSSSLPPRPPPLSLSLLSQFKLKLLLLITERPEVTLKTLLTQALKQPRSSHRDRLHPPYTHSSHTPTYTHIFSHKYTQSPTLLKHFSHILIHHSYTPHILHTHTLFTPSHTQIH